jgi:hypothetical protein
MDKDSFKAGMDQLADYTGKRMTNRQLRQMYRYCKEIETSAWEAIVEAFIYEIKPIPSAMPTIGQIKKAWYKHRSIHKAWEYEQVTPCDYCRGTGVGYRLVKDQETRQVAKNLGICRRCDNWRSKFSPAAIKEVSRDGGVIDTTTTDYPGGRYFLPFVEVEPRPMTGNYKQRYIEALLDGIGKEVP